MLKDNAILKKFNLLFVEDDEIIREELSSLLSNFFKNVYCATDGREGLEIFHKNKIDIILSDINMPNLNGLDMVQELKKTHPYLPVIFATAYSDTKYLIQALKLRVHDYIIKPIDIKNLILILRDIAKKLHQSSIFEQYTKELKKYKEIIDLTNIIVKTDEKMNIIYVNELFCKTSGFSKEELIGKEFKSLKYKDSSENIYIKLYDEVLKNKFWRGNLKNITKNGENYITDSYVLAILDENENITGTISIQRDITEELNKKREIQLALLRDKSECFIKNKEDSLEQNQLINNLKRDLEKKQKSLETNSKNINNLIDELEKYKRENSDLNTQLSLLKMKSNDVNTVFKLTKENADLKQELKKLKQKIEQLTQNNEKSLINLKIQYELTIDELKNKFEKEDDDISSIKFNNDLKEKALFWEKKAKDEMAKLEKLEKQIITHGDAKLMEKIFG